MAVNNFKIFFIFIFLPAINNRASTILNRLAVFNINWGKLEK